MENRHSIKYLNSKLSYIKAGNSENVIFAFHGFGQSSTEFHHYINSLEINYTVYYFDHFFHGKSEWKEEREILVSDIENIFNFFFTQEGIENFEVIAYSLGGKLASTLFRLFPSRIKKLTLCAPDGAKTNFSYSFSSRNFIGRKLFKQTIKHPQFFYQILRLAYSLNIIKKGLYRFVYFQMKGEKNRKQVFNTWTKYRKLKGLSEKTIRLLNEHNTPVHFILGEYDRVIRPKYFNKLKSKIKNVKFDVLKKGHRTILTEIAKLHNS